MAAAPSTSNNAARGKAGCSLFQLFGIDEIPKFSRVGTLPPRSSRIMSHDGGGKTRGVPDAAADQSWRPPPNYYYGTFQGVANYQPQPQPPPPNYSVMGFPQPVPPPPIAGQHYPHGYHTVPGYIVAHGRPFREERLPCCGVGLGWFLFITGFFFGAVPWYIGAFILLCVRMDYREKPGLIACTIAALLAAVAVSLGVTKATHSW